MLPLEGMVVTSEFTFYVGVDWATEHHQVCIWDCDGRLVRQQRVLMAMLKSGQAYDPTRRQSNVSAPAA